MMATGTLRARAEARRSGTVLFTYAYVYSAATHLVEKLIRAFSNICFYRCIRMSKGAVCTLVQKACEESELTPSELRLPDVTLWIDPLEVCAR